MIRFTRFLSGCILTLGLSVFLWDSARAATAYQEEPCSPTGTGAFCDLRCHWPVVECEGDGDNLECWLDRCQGGIQVLFYDPQPDPEAFECLSQCELGDDPYEYIQCILECIFTS